MDKFPSIQVYLDEEEYLELALLAKEKRQTTSGLIRKAVKQLITQTKQEKPAQNGKPPVLKID